MKKRARKPRDRVAKLEAEVADLKAKLAVALAMIPNVNTSPVARFAAFCPAHTRYC